MTKDELLRIAIKCNLIGTTNREGVYADALEAFANLVAAAERAKCVKKLEAEGQYYCRDTLLNGRKS